jgi:hypothetical protein
MKSLRELRDRRFEAVVLDVRGTLIDPVLDTPVSNNLIRSVLHLLRGHCAVSVNTATSIRSLQTLLLAPLCSEITDTACLSGASLYVDSSTAAYYLSEGGAALPLPGFEFLRFTESELDGICKAMSQVISEFGLDAVHKVKAGQVNFYCGGSWLKRRSIADYLNRCFRDSGMQRVVAMVPTAKETIDIAVSKKDRGIRDLIEHLGIPYSAMVVIGDSMQQGAPDLDMALSAPGCLAIQVGPVQPAVGVLHLSQMEAPEAVRLVLDGVWRNVLGN